MFVPNNFSKIFRLGLSVLCSVTALILLTLLLNSATVVAAPVLNTGTGADPEIRRITMTANSLAVYDPTGGAGLAKTVFFSNTSAGTLTVTFDLSGTVPLSLTGGAAFETDERVLTLTESPLITEVVYRVPPTLTTQANILYLASGVATATVPITYVQDITAPTSQIDFPAAGDYISANLILATGAASDIVSDTVGSGIGRLQFSADDGATWEEITATMPSTLGLSWAYSWAPPLADASPYTLAVRAQDQLGTWQSIKAATWITADRAAPIGTVVFTPNLLANHWTNQSDLHIEWSGFRDNALVGYQYLITNTAVLALPDSAGVITDQSSADQALEDGQWYFHVAAVDRAGNWSQTATTGTFQIDTISPTVIITAPAQWRDPQNPLPVEWQANDSRSGIHAAQLYYRQIPDGNWLPADQPEYDVTTGIFYFTPTANIIYSLAVRAIDHAGNIRTSNEERVRLERFDVFLPLICLPAPVPQITQFAVNRTYVFTPQVTLAISAVVKTDTVTGLQLSNDSPPISLTFGPFASTVTQLLNTGTSGLRTIYGRVQGGQGGVSAFASTATYLFMNGDFSSGLANWNTRTGAFNGIGSGLEITPINSQVRLGVAGDRQYSPIGYRVLSQTFMLPAGSAYHQLKIAYDLHSYDDAYFVKSDGQLQLYDTLEISLDPPETVTGAQRQTVCRQRGSPHANRLLLCDGAPESTSVTLWETGLVTKTLDLQNLGTIASPVTVYITLWSREYDPALLPNNQALLNTWAEIEQVWLEK